VFRKVRGFEVREGAPAVVGWTGDPFGGAAVTDGPQTVLRSVPATDVSGLERDDGGEQLTDTLIGMVMEEVRRDRSDGLRSGVAASMTAASAARSKSRAKRLGFDQLQTPVSHGCLSRQLALPPCRSGAR
jgi:hypothetical protein